MMQDTGLEAWEFTRRLDAELAWRRRELHLVKAEIERASAEKREALLRAGTTVLYAHWEGFVKRVAEEYLYFIKRKAKHERLSYDAMGDAFVAMGLRRSVQAVGTAKRMVPYVRAASFMRERLSESVEVIMAAADTAANLNYDVFLALLICTGIDHQRFADERLAKQVGDLVKARNSVAHGEYHNVGWAVFCEYFVCVEELLELVQNEFANAAVTRAYLRPLPDCRGVDDTLRPEYDPAELKGRTRGKYAAAYREGTNAVLLDPDVWEAFPTSEAVNEALRLLMKAARAATHQNPPSSQ
jgi:hypothetical protein